MRALEQPGPISGYSVQIEQHAVGLKLKTFVEITFSSDSREAMECFE